MPSTMEARMSSLMKSLLNAGHGGKFAHLKIHSLGAAALDVRPCVGSWGPMRLGTIHLLEADSLAQGDAGRADRCGFVDAEMGN